MALNLLKVNGSDDSIDGVYEYIQKRLVNQIKSAFSPETTGMVD